MKNLVFKIYMNSPSFVKRILANLEAVRRDRYRRNKDFEIDIDNSFYNMFHQSSTFKLDKIIELLKYANKNVRYYNNLDYKCIDSEERFSKLPILNKEDVRNNLDSMCSEESSKRKLWKGKSSGSTGVPLAYFRDRTSVLTSQYNNEEYYKFCGCDIKANKVRISGIKVAPFEEKKPPYWVYIDKYKQLQCSTYHINSNTFKLYLREFEKINATYGTGFPSAWSALSELMVANSIHFNGFTAIITDSEGLTHNQREIIERAFRCPVYSTYGLGEVGIVAVECNQGKYHCLPSHYIEIVDSEGKKTNDGEVGQIVITDYSSKKFPYIRYATGDLGKINYNYNCSCDIKTPVLDEISGRIEDYVLTKDGRKITRLTQLISPAVGITACQIIQKTTNQLLIKIVPSEYFEPQSMEKVVSNAKKFVGDMKVDWVVVDQLEKMPSGKVKFVVREFLKDDKGESK